MKIGLYNYGTRGDLHPFIALAIGLKERGYDIKLVCITPYASDFSDFERECGIIFERVLDPDFYKNNPLSLSDLEKEPVKVRHYFDYLDYCAHRAMQKLAEECDVIIAASGAFEMRGYAEKLGKTIINLCLQYHLIPSDKRKPKYIKEEKSIVEAWNDIEMHHLPKQEQINAFRSHIGLPPLKYAYREATYSSILNLVAISDLFCDPLKDGWNDTFKVCGYLAPPIVSKEKKIADSLISFLSSGEPPIFFSMGSAAHFDKDPIERIKIIISSVRSLNKRLVVQCTNSEEILHLCENDKNIYVIHGPIDHRVIMPQCSIIIHHGGTGTTHAACISGRPSIVLHYWGDMPDWAEDMQNIGVSGDTIYAHDLTTEWLTAELKKILGNPTMLARAADIGEAMKGENAIERAIDFLEEAFSKNRKTMRQFVVDVSE